MSNLNYAIRIAIAGKREHPKLSNLLTDGRIEKILDILNEMHNEIAITSELKVQFLSGLADGADQMVTSKVAGFRYTNDKGKKLRPYIDAVLPFSELNYRNHPLYEIANKT